jgi:hypothetical protein
LIVDDDDLPNIDGLCKPCSRAVQTWRDPAIAEIVFNMDFNLPSIPTTEIKNHHSVTALKECTDKEACPLCTLMYSAILYREKKELNRQRLPENGTTFTYSGRFIDTSTMSGGDVRFGPQDESRYQHGDLVMSTSEGDIDAIRDDEVQLPFGRVSIALCSGNAGAGETPYLEIRVGQTHRSELDIYPVRGKDISI